MDIHVYVHTESGRVDRKLDQILTHLVRLTALEKSMDAATQAALDKLMSKVTETQDVETSIETTLNGLSAIIAELKNGQTDPIVIQKINEATAIVDAVIARAKAAVIANTPAA